MADPVDTLHQAFATYRQTHRRGAYPRPLRQRALDTLSAEQLLQLAARLGLTAAQIARWKAASEAVPQSTDFFEIEKDAATSATTMNCRVEVATCSGATLRLYGDLDPRVLGVLVETLQRART